MELPFVTLDVFTGTRFKGNPLAVVTIPTGTAPAPTQAQKQAIAREFNLSETVFVHEPSDGDEDNASTTRKIDIFLPDAEVPFAGHPTIGTAVSLLPKGITTLVTKAGPIGITRTGPSAVRAAVPHAVRLHRRRLRDLGPDFAEKLFADPALRAAELDARVVSIVRQLTFVLIELPSLEALAALPEQSGVRFPSDGRLLDEGWEGGFVGRYYFVRTGSGSGSGSGEEDGARRCSLRTRLITYAFEDPATGSAACCLSSFLSLTDSAAADHLQRPVRYDITQGVEMGRESSIAVEVTLKDASTIDTVTLAGEAVQVMRGHVAV